MQRTLAINTLLGLIISTQLLAFGNAPIQRVDVVNLLGSGGGATAVSVAFGTDSSAIPCFTKKLAYKEAITIWAGVGQLCTTAVTSIAVTPIADAWGVLIYDAPLIPTYLSSSYYSAQITISQDTSPIFDPNNGALISTGTINVNASSRLTH